MKRTQNTKVQAIGTTHTRSSSPIREQTLGDRIYLKLGHFGTRVLYRAVALVLLALVLFTDYLIVLFTAVNVLPNIAVLVQQGTGVTLDLRIDAVIAGWLLPVLFISAAVLVGELYIMRRLGRLATDLKASLASYLFRLAIELDLPAPAAATAGTATASRFVVAKPRSARVPVTS